MSQDNVDVVRRCYALWETRDFAAIPEVAHPDVVVDLSRNVFNPGVYRGMDGFLRFVAQVDEMWDDLRLDPEEFIDADDDNVVAVVRLSGTGRVSGVPADMRVFSIWALRDGKVARMTGGYRNRAEVLADAGLSG
jgi:ketosteroid isomerase-like protein